MLIYIGGNDVNGFRLEWKIPAGRKAAKMEDLSGPNWNPASGIWGKHNFQRCMLALGYDRRDWSRLGAALKSQNGKRPIGTLFFVGWCFLVAEMKRYSTRR
jgi:hypothetical protein